jgi:hypothetical protein
MDGCVVCMFLGREGWRKKEEWGKKAKRNVN